MLFKGLFKVKERFPCLDWIQVDISSLSLVADPTMEVESVLASGEKDYLELKSRLFELRELSVKQGSAL